jgi:hypothetical protein
MPTETNEPAQLSQRPQGTAPRSSRQRQYADLEGFTIQRSTQDDCVSELLSDIGGNPRVRRGRRRKHRHVW